jgi:hypothetical protein
MSFNSVGDGLKAKAAREVSPAISEVAIFKQLIKERAHPLDLIRELLSNAARRRLEPRRSRLATPRTRTDIFSKSRTTDAA